MGLLFFTSKLIRRDDDWDYFYYFFSQVSLLGGMIGTILFTSMFDVGIIISIIHPYACFSRLIIMHAQCHT